MAPPPGGAEIETVRPDGRRQSFAFQIGAGFLQSLSEIPEPHEFRVVLTLGGGAARHRYETSSRRKGTRTRRHGTSTATTLTGSTVMPRGHGHTHGIVDPTISTTARGLWAASGGRSPLFSRPPLLQLVVVVLSNSVALLADH